MSCNASKGWPRGGIYDLYRNGTLPEGYAFIQSLYNATKIRTPQSRQSSSEYLRARARLYLDQLIVTGRQRKTFCARRLIALSRPTQLNASNVRRLRTLPKKISTARRRTAKRTALALIGPQAGEGLLGLWHDAPSFGPRRGLLRRASAHTHYLGEAGLNETGCRSQSLRQN